MKKFVFPIMLLVCIVCMSACGPGKSELARFSDGLNSIRGATVTETVTLKDDSVIEYERNASYVLDGNSYNVATTVRRRNIVGSAEPYSDTASTATVDASALFTADITLDKKYLDDVTITNGVLRADVEDRYVDDVFGTTDSAVTDVELTVTMRDDKVTKLVITFEYTNLDGTLTLTVA